MNSMERLDEWLAAARSDVARRVPDPLSSSACWPG